MALVLGIGSGLFALIIIWIVGLILCVVFSRVSALRNGVVGIGILIIALTVILILYPRESDESPKETSKQPVDNLSVLRTTIFAGACLLAVISLVLMLVFHWMEPQYAPALLARKKYTF
ncbi:transmembrane protein 218-like [Dendronephthya gigantea]|uniref:transmembrane protein 218-like n=1 Tax=Dendronephthya gigantea TaxID=151771 RepID=UPI00106A8EB6|nr:transmembrane protein 218-like [Dendronephthya gigantea]